MRREPRCCGAMVLRRSPSGRPPAPPEVLLHAAVDVHVRSLAQVATDSALYLIARLDKRTKAGPVPIWRHRFKVTGCKPSNAATCFEVRYSPDAWTPASTAPRDSMS